MLGDPLECEAAIRGGQDDADAVAHAGARGGPLHALARRRADEGLRADPAQEAAAAALQRLHEALLDYRPQPARRRGLLWLAGPGARDAPAPRGLYLHGPVGRGKTMLMDLFFAGAPLARRRRVHFSAFMIEVHERLHRLRQGAAGGGDLVPRLAAAMAAEAPLLCLDELQVDNIGDAMLLHRLFRGLLDAGAVIVATSNWAPDALYSGGLQRDRFLPFIALLKERLDILHLEGGTDYRRARLGTMQVYHCPLGPEAEAKLAQAFAALTDGAAPHALELETGGRTLQVRRCAKDVAWFTFEELCGQPLGGADYLALARRFHTIIVSSIPVLDAQRRDEARRLTLLVDVLYEHGTKLVCSAAAAPDRLFDIPRDATLTARAVSRLVEMQTLAYLARPLRAEKSRENVDPHLL